MSDITETAEQITDQFDGHDVDHEDVEGRLRTLVEEYKVPLEEATRTVTNHYADELGVDRDDVYAGGGQSTPGVTPVGDIDMPDAWVTVEVTVVELWDSDHDSIDQTGLVGDESGRIKFVSWAKSDVDTLEEGASYRLESVTTDEYNGRYSIQLNSQTEVIPLDEEIEVGDDAVIVEGCVVSIHPSSGLIERCTAEGCSRLLDSGRCTEHGDIDGEDDLRIKAVVDDGERAQTVFCDAELTEVILGYDIDAALEQAREALDKSVVRDDVEAALLGSYVGVTGPDYGSGIMADELDELGAPSAEAREQVLVRGRSM